MDVNFLKGFTCSILVFVIKYKKLSNSSGYKVEIVTMTYYCFEWIHKHDKADKVKLICLWAILKVKKYSEIMVKWYIMFYSNLLDNWKSKLNYYYYFFFQCQSGRYDL